MRPPFQDLIFAPRRMRRLQLPSRRSSSLVSRAWQTSEEGLRFRRELCLQNGDPLAARGLGLRRRRRHIPQLAGSGPAVIASDVDAPGEYVQGVLSDLHIRGAQKDGQEGIYVGGDSACQNTCMANPAANVGYNYVFRNITVLNIGGNGIRYGNSAFNLLWDNVHSNNNRGYGLYVSHTAVGGGQFNTWTHSQLAGNALGGWWIDQLPFVTFEMLGMDVQYNVGNDGVSTHAEGTGGHIICVGCHFEHKEGAFLSLNSDGQFYKGDDIQLVGGQLIAMKPGVTDPYLILADGAARFTSTGTYIAAFHNVAQMIFVKQPQVASISVLATSISSVGFRFGGITAARGQGVRYEQPIDVATQAPNAAGTRYFGGLTSFDTVEADTLRARNGFSGTCKGGVVRDCGDCHRLQVVRSWLIAESAL